MRWIDAKSPEELKVLGSFQAVKREISKDIKIITEKKEITKYINLGSNSWSGLYVKIQDLKKISQSIENEKPKSIKIEIIPEDYFKSDAHKYIFYLLELEGKERISKLKINKSHYKNKDIARLWYRDIVKKITPDKVKGKYVAEAMIELNSIYNKMLMNE